MRSWRTGNVALLSEDIRPCFPNWCQLIMKNKLRSNPSRLGNAGERVTRIASWRDDKRTANARGYTYEWQQARLEHLRANPFCVMCRVEGRVTQATHVDHIKPHNGNMAVFWNRDNWQSLCAHCHSAHKQRIERANVGASKHKATCKRVEPANVRDDDATPHDLTMGEGGVKVAPPVDT